MTDEIEENSETSENFQTSEVPPHSSEKKERPIEVQRPSKYEEPLEPTKPSKIRKVEMTPQRDAALKKAREMKAIKKKELKNKKEESMLFRSVEDEKKLFELWQKKQMLKKDNAWSTLLNERLTHFENSIIEALNGRPTPKSQLRKPMEDDIFDEEDIRPPPPPSRTPPQQQQQRPQAKANFYVQDDPFLMEQQRPRNTPQQHKNPYASFF